MVKRSLPKHVYRYGKKGLLYFRTPSGKLHRMPDDPTSAEFAREYAKMRSGRAPMPAKRNIKKLIGLYMQSPKWDALAENTRKSYRRCFRYLEEKIGHIDPASIRPVHVHEMRDAMSDTPATANRRVGALSVLLAYAIRLDWIDRNPALGVENLKSTREARKPWPAHLIEAARAEADPETLLLFEMLLGTGQRIGDVLAMQWAHIEDGGIWVSPSKGRRQKKRLYVPFTSRLADMLAATPRRSLYIVSQPNGRPVSYQLAWKRIMELRKQIGAEAYDNHALRYAAASEIASLPGMTVEHVQAITGHTSTQLVDLYAGSARQQARAKEAQKGRK